MIRFLLKGLLRDKSRSRVPIMIVAAGVMLSVFLHAYITGLMNDSIEMNARMSNGHVKVVTRAFADNISQMPTDLALLEITSLQEELSLHFPDMDWAARIQFGGLIDVPDENGETRAQGPSMGMGIDLLSSASKESERIGLARSLVQGELPDARGEVLLSDEFAQKLEVKPGDEITLIGSTMYGGMSYYNFIVSGTVSFGVQVLDKGTVIADIEDVRLALDMPDAATEIVGFFEQGYFSSAEAEKVKKEFAQAFSPDPDDEYAPIVLSLKDQGNMGQFVELSGTMGSIITIIFMLAMALVLWNAGLLGGIRRYGEFGVRLAMGEEKKHVYRTLLYESVMIGIAGSVVGTVFGLFFAWLMQEYGLNLGDSMKGSSMMLPTVIRARITPVDFYIGFIPGIVSTLIGAALAGIGIYRRKTSQLFKELEA
ncbi:ABC transporter permease [Roseimarinus sediminis]|uniref:ABC transporter permease n=1 Tax=Roseimarinus sediminis TaxID=1610899 RepID=UPI003D1BED09